MLMRPCQPDLILTPTHAARQDGCPQKGRVQSRFEPPLSAEGHGNRDSTVQGGTAPSRERPAITVGISPFSTGQLWVLTGKAGGSSLRFSALRRWRRQGP